MKIRPKLLAVIICSQLICFAHAQNRFTLPQVSPKSPNAAEFEKYGDIPVSMSNGTANISIPLYTIRVGQLEIPITLSYNSNGLKVDEIPSYVGMGWSINAGGVINYEQRGLPDFGSAAVGMFTPGTYNSLDSVKKFLRNGMSAVDANAYLEKVTEGIIDGEFDFYNYSFPGSSGSFYLDTNQRIITVPASNNKVLSTNTILDERGNRFLFNVYDHNQSLPDPDPAKAMKPSFSENASYYLGSIQTTDNRTVYFGYTPAYPIYYSTPNQVVSVMSAKPLAECPGSSQATGYTYTSLDNNMLSEISYDGGKVIFELGSEYRNDILQFATTSNVPYLKKVKIYNGANKLITEYSFNYTNGNRLSLDEVVRTDTSGSPARWQFEYISGGDVKLFSGDKDHWGFYNAHGDGIPNANYSALVTGWAGNASTYDRESNLEFARRGLLKKITWPTGGSSVFEYESNSITFTSPSQLTDHPFLQRPYPSALTPIVSENTSSQDEISGSFTLTQATLVSVSVYKWYQPMVAINSIVRLSKTPTGANLLDSYPFGFQCGSFACTAEASTTLDPGTYYYTLKKYFDDSGLYTDGFASLDISKQEYLPSFTYEMGGCRIASVKHTDSAGNTLFKKYKYVDRYDSVGYVNIPFYLSKMNLYVNSWTACLECGLKTTISDESVRPMSGNPVEYLYVSEYTDDNGNNGVTTYNFTPNENINPGPGPYLSPFKANWRAGQLKSKKQFRKNGSAYELVQQDTTTYESILANTGISRGVKAEYSTYCSTPGLGRRYYSYQIEQYGSEQFNTKSQSQIYYDGTGNITSTSENIFGSTKHTLPTETRTLNSAGDTLRERIKYSFDYDTTTITGNEAKAIRLLQRKNILVPIEKVSTKKVSGVEYVTQAILFTYKSDTAAMDRVFELLLADPAAYSGFANSTITAGNLTKDSRYDESARFTLYDNYLNVLQMQASNNIIRSYLWDHNQLYPVCEVNGAAQTEIGYTSFETGNNGYWTVTGGTLDSSVALTGRRCLNPGTGNLSRANLSNGKQYIISYWSRSGAKTITGGSGTSKTGMVTNGWTYYEHLITTSGTTLTVSGTGLMDELRLYPAGAQMNSITYMPAIGITSQCDSRNNVAYYEYDNQNRLMHVRDVKGNILKKVQYTYRANALTP